MRFIDSSAREETDPVSAVGDPHVISVTGEKFDLCKTGRSSFVPIPEDLQPESVPKLLITGNVVSYAGDICAPTSLQNVQISESMADGHEVLARAVQAECEGFRESSSESLSGTLLQNKILRVIKKNLVKKCLEMLAEIAEKKDDYTESYEKFGKCLNSGNHEDSTIGAKIAELLRLNVSTSEDEQLSLKEYVDLMKVQKTMEVPQVQYINKIVDVPVVAQRHVSTIQIVQRTVEVPHVQFLDRAADVSVVMQRRNRERIVGETIDAPVPHVTEKIIEVVKHIPQERVQNGTEEQIVDVPVPQCRNETGEVIQIFSQDQISDRIVVQIVGRSPVQHIREQIGEVMKLTPQERVQDHAGEEIVDMPGPQIQEETGRMTQLIPQKTFSDHVVEQTVDVPGAKSIPQECVQRHKLQARLPEDIVPVAGPQVQVVDVPDRVDDVSVSRQRQTPMTREVPKTVNSPRVQLIDKVVSIPVMAQRQVPSAQRVQKIVEMPQIQRCSNRSVPQILEQTVEAPQIIPREFVPNHRLAPKKRKSISECGMTEDEPSEHDVRRASAFSCEVSCETHSLVQGGESRLEVDERLLKGTRQTKGKVSVCSRWRQTWRPVAHTSRPRQRRSKSSTGPKTCARSAEWSSYWCAAKGSST